MVSQKKNYNKIKVNSWVSWIGQSISIPYSVCRCTVCTFEKRMRDRHSRNEDILYYSALKKK